MNFNEFQLNLFMEFLSEGFLMLEYQISMDLSFLISEDCVDVEMRFRRFSKRGI
jgi:hypothetical protein